MLPNDVQRCTGADCDKREQCQRYIERETGGQWTPVGSDCEDYAGFIQAEEL